MIAKKIFACVLGIGISYLLMYHPWSWSIPYAIAACVVGALILARFQPERFGERLYVFKTQSLIPFLVVATGFTAILYFANSREFYLVESEEHIRDPSHVVVSEAQYFSGTDEHAPAQVMIKRPFSWKRDALKPFTLSLIVFTFAPYGRPSKAQQNQ